PGDECDRGAEVAVGHRYSGVRWSCITGGDAGHNFKVNDIVRQSLCLFATASKNERVASLQACDHFARPGFLNQQSVDVLLRNRMAAAAFPHADPLSTGQ